MKPRTKNVVGQKRWSEAIEPVSQFARANRGFSTALVRRLEKRFRARKKNWRVMLNVWLTSNQARRVEPLAGTGIVVLEEAEALMDAWTKKGGEA